MQVELLPCGFNNLGRAAPAYGDSTESMMQISREGGGNTEGARNWPILVGSNENGGVEGRPTVAVGRGNQDGRRSLKVPGETSEPGMDVGGDTGERWDAVALGEDRASIQRGEREQADWSNQSRQRGLEGGELSWGLYNGERGRSEEKWGGVPLGGRRGGDPWATNGGGGGVVYQECQKNQAADRGTTAVDGCGEFMPAVEANVGMFTGMTSVQSSHVTSKACSAAKEGKSVLACAACGCHRNFHRRVGLGDDEDEREEERERGLGGGKEHTSIRNIECVAHELMAAASRAIPLLSQDSLIHRKGRARDTGPKERNTMAKICVENLDHIAKVMLSTAECLALLQKPSSNPHHTSSRDRERDKSVGASPPLPAVVGSFEGPLSSDVSPVSTVEKRGMPNPPVFSLQPCIAAAGGSQTMVMAGGIGSMHGSIGVSRKLSDRGLGNHKSKRKRTRISVEQRDKLNAFAQKAGWTVVGQRKETIEAACLDIGIEPKTLKYWIHNSKQKWKRQPGHDDDMIGN